MILGSSTDLLSLSTLFAFTLIGIGCILFPADSGGDTTHHSIRFASENEEAEDGDEDDDREGWTEVVSWEPRAIIYHNFLTKAECQHLIKISKPHLQRSRVKDPNTGGALVSSARTSYGMFLRHGQDAIVSNIEKRIADFTFIPVENGEGIHILRYENGQDFKPHMDCSVNDFGVMRGGLRIATVLMYLSNVEEGGETVFPLAKGISTVSKRSKVSGCARAGLAVKPRMGDALLFWNVKPDGTIDSKSKHGSRPVINGTKWSATMWLHAMKFK